MKTLPTKPELIFEYVDKKDRKMISLRLPIKLIKEIEDIAKKKGWTKTEVIQYALDQFAQIESKSK